MYKDIVQIIQSEVDKIDKRVEYKKKYDTIFTVSYLLNDLGNYDNEKSHKIVLTVNRGKTVAHSRVIFPKSRASDYESLEREMEYLYNSTM